jgi:chemotaxis response regulator CheB
LPAALDGPAIRAMMCEARSNGKEALVAAATESQGHDIVVVGASAGGVEALRAIVTHLPADLDATVFVVLHLPPGGTSVLPRILQRAGQLRAVHASHRQRFDRSCIYIAPPDQHMRFANGHIELDRGPARTATARRSTRCSAPPPRRSAAA